MGLAPNQKMIHSNEPFTSKILRLKELTGRGGNFIWPPFPWDDQPARTLSKGCTSQWDVDLHSVFQAKAIVGSLENPVPSRCRLAIPEGFKNVAQ
jgi:hypothetical protein